MENKIKDAIKCHTDFDNSEKLLRFGLDRYCEIMGATYDIIEDVIPDGNKIRFTLSRYNSEYDFIFYVPIQFFEYGYDIYAYNNFTKFELASLSTKKNDDIISDLTKKINKNEQMLYKIEESRDMLIMFNSDVNDGIIDRQINKLKQEIVDTHGEIKKLILINENNQDLNKYEPRINLHKNNME